MLSALPSLTVPAILRNLCTSDKNGSSLGSVVTTLSRPLHVDICWNISLINPIHGVLSPPPVPFLCSLPCLALCPGLRAFGVSSVTALRAPPYLADRGQSTYIGRSPIRPLRIIAALSLYLNERFSPQLSLQLPSSPPCLSTIPPSVLQLPSSLSFPTSLHPIQMPRVSGSTNAAPLPRRTKKRQYPTLFLRPFST